MPKHHEALIIEDNSTAIFLCQRMLNQTNAFNKITTKTNGLIAIEYIHDKISIGKQLPTLILLDISMPVMDGHQFLREFRQIVPATQKPPTIVVLTTSELKEDK
ncbi:MAG: response regulator, partial [Flavobacteriales bacterium]|nr:response regulator [Flavobacteriales bacterium]